ncbi:hypothetical protein RZ64_06270 [[Haemophilus] ducreyi]|nr:hypothetical protein RZ62_08610 [[Haemophilus] ducreyi]AKO41553.1 hypothetical protein RZ64_06270 [[Haemophilus] ducreyi]
MTQKLSKQELGERLLLKEKQERLTKQINALTQEIGELALPFIPKAPKPPPLFDYYAISCTSLARIWRLDSMRRNRRTSP